MTVYPPVDERYTRSLVMVRCLYGDVLRYSPLPEVGGSGQWQGGGYRQAQAMVHRGGG